MLLEISLGSGFSPVVGVEPNNEILLGAAGGVRTHDIQNHNLALLPAELQPPQLLRCISLVYHFNPAFLQSSSTRCFTSFGIAITPGHGRRNPSCFHFFVASIPIFDP